jgi:hypothetical protein
MKITTMLLACAIVLAACDSDDPNSTPGSVAFPRNTEWVGTMDRAGYQYAPPADIQFRDKDEFVIYGPHIILQEGGWSLADSVKGTITSVTEVDNTTIEIKTNIESYGAITMTIKDRKTLTALSADGSKVQFSMDYYEAAKSFQGTFTGPIITGSGPSVGMNAYPDLSTITFDLNGQTSYTRYGQQVQVGVSSPAPGLRILFLPYKKVGATIFMEGWNESLLQPVGYRYMGVLMPGDREMMVHSNVTGARLPYYAQSIPWYGPIGQTPIIKKLE